jgi:hypothetical protein
MGLSEQALLIELSPFAHLPTSQNGVSKIPVVRSQAPFNAFFTGQDSDSGGGHGRGPQGAGAHTGGPQVIAGPQDGGGHLTGGAHG